MSEAPKEKVLVYTGPSLDPESIREQIPDAIIKGPVRQGDFISDAMEYEPTHVLIIEGEFHQSLSLWHKEIVWALQIPGIKAIYGAASMGALRAADLADYGMIGCGRIFQWYFEGVITDESEVAASYHQTKDGNYVSLTVPLVNVRGALLKGLETGLIDPLEADELFSLARSILWSSRSLKMLEGFDSRLGLLLASHNQKAIDALELVCTFRSLQKLEGHKQLEQDALSGLFSAQFERDRSVYVNGRELKLQDLDAFITLHDQDYEEHTKDADNRVLALFLADIYRISYTPEELDDEWRRFSVRMGLRSLQEHDAWLRQNHMNGRELVRVLGDEVRLRKLRRALMTRSGPRRRTQRLLDYLKLSRQYPYWSVAAARHEELVKRAGAEEALQFGGQLDVSLMLSEHAKRSGQTISLSLEDYVKEMGFGSIRELMVALARDRLADQDAQLPDQ
jgi:hypothetical protein